MSTETIEVVDTTQINVEQQAVKLYELTPAAIRQLADNYLTLKANDKPSYMAVQTAHKETKKLRLKVQNRQKELQKPLKKQIEDIAHVAGTIINLLEPAEEHLEKERKDYEAEQERLKQLEIKRKEEVRQNRINLLRDNGCTFTGDVYAIGNEVIEAVSLAEIPEDIFSAVLGRVKAEKARIDEERRVLDLEAKLAEERHNELLNYRLSVPRSQLGSMPADEYKDLLQQAINEHNDRIAQAAELNRRNQLRIDRTLELATYGGSTTVTDLADIPDDEYAALISEVKAEYEAFIAEKKRLKVEADNRVKLLAALEMVDAEQKLSEQAEVVLTKDEPMYPNLFEIEPQDTEPTEICEMCEPAPVTLQEIIEHTENAIIDSLASNSIAAPIVPTVPKAAAIISMLRNEFDIMFPSFGIEKIEKRIEQIING